MYTYCVEQSITTHENIKERKETKKNEENDDFSKVQDKHDNLVAILYYYMFQCNEKNSLFNMLSSSNASKA